MATAKKSFFFLGVPPEIISPAAPPGPQFEFDESDILWDNEDFHRGGPGGTRRPSSSSSIPSSRRPVVGSKKPKADDRPASLPVSVPEWPELRRESGEDGGGERRAVVVPPHEYLARRRGASMSVHEGVGRTLKGRDLSRVRNAIWKQIGFED